MNNFNGFLWSILDGMGWWYWTPWVLLAIRNLYLLSRMGPAVSATGRTARVLAWVGHFAMLFSPVFNVMGCFALPLLLMSNNLYYRQLKKACDAARPSPNPQYRGQTILNALVQPEDKMKRQA